MVLVAGSLLGCWAWPLGYAYGMALRAPEQPAYNGGRQPPAKDDAVKQEHVCPWWMIRTFDNPLRRLFHQPEKLLGPT